MKRKVIYKNGKLVEVKTVYVLLDEEGNIIRYSDYHIPFSKKQKQEKIILDFDEMEDAPV